MKRVQLQRIKSNLQERCRGSSKSPITGWIRWNAMPDHSHWGVTSIRADVQSLGSGRVITVDKKWLTAPPYWQCTWQIPCGRQQFEGKHLDRCIIRLKQMSFSLFIEQISRSSGDLCNAEIRVVATELLKFNEAWSSVGYITTTEEMLSDRHYPRLYPSLNVNFSLVHRRCRDSSIHFAVDVIDPCCQCPQFL